MPTGIGPFKNSENKGLVNIKLLMLVSSDKVWVLSLYCSLTLSQVSAMAELRQINNGEVTSSHELVWSKKKKIAFCHDLGLTAFKDSQHLCEEFYKVLLDG